MENVTDIFELIHDGTAGFKAKYGKLPTRIRCSVDFHVRLAKACPDQGDRETLPPAVHSFSYGRLDIIPDLAFEGDDLDFLE